MRIGIDVGGTFTDVVLADDTAGRFHYTKVSTTPPDLWVGVLNGLDKILEMAGAAMSDVDYIVHGTTIGTNALIERKGARTGLITNAGFIDVLEIGRLQRPDAGLYNFLVDNPPPLVPRELRKGVTGRIDRYGAVVTPLDEESVQRAVMELQAEGVESIAVSFLFSFMNPAHEERTVEIIRQLLPNMYISYSAGLSPEMREYERTSTAVINAYLQPIMKVYLDRLTAEIEAKYGPVDLRIMQASGGTMTVASARERAIHTVNSGPAGGVLAAAAVGALVNQPMLLGVDMGGTSFDISVIEDGAAKVTAGGKFEGLAIKIPIIEVDAIGAGGGSIAWIDRGGALNMGPESAGAWPGPASYGRGGSRPTCTDANVVLGRLNPDYFLGGEMQLDVAAAREAIARHVAVPLGISVEEAAIGMIRVINAKMAKGISSNTVEKGLDARELALVSFGGAAAVHAAELAAELGMATVILPPLAGNLSALGLLVSDARHDFVQTLVVRAESAEPSAVYAALMAMEAQGLAALTDEHYRPEDIEFVWTADMRYEGQAYELQVPIERRQLSETDLQAIVASFHDLHRRRYAYSSESEPVQFINLRVAATGKSPRMAWPQGPVSGPEPAAAAKKGSRQVYFAGRDWVDAALYERDRLAPGNVIYGPGVVEERTSALVIPPDWRGRIDTYGNIVMTSPAGLG